MSTKKADKAMRRVVFEKTVAIFSDLLSIELDLDIGSQSQASTNGQTIFIPESMFQAGITQLCYPLYVCMEHELAHIIFNTDFYDFDNFRDSKENKELAAWCYNMAEDERIESCWNLIYRTPFRHNYSKLFIKPNVRRGKQLTTMDVIMDVRGDFIRNKNDDYLKAWKEIRYILDGVKGIVLTSSTMRVAEQLYNYFMQRGMLLSGTCDMIAGERNRRKLAKEGRKKMGKIRIDPNITHVDPCGGGGCQPMSEDDYKLMKDMLRRYGNYFKHGNVFKDESKMPTGGNVDEKQFSHDFLESLKEKLIPDYIAEKPENKIMVGNVEFKPFYRREPTPIDKSIKTLLPLRRKEVRWYAEVGEFDPDEYIQKTIRKDLNDIDYFEDTINIRGMDVIFLVDYSGSMGGYYGYGRDRDYKGKEYYLKQTIYSMWKSMEMIPGVNVETIIFSGGWGTTTPMEIIKDPEEVLRVSPGGSTHTYRALDYVHRKLEFKRDRRRFVFLITDGEPTPDRVVHQPYAYCKRVIDRMRKDRIDLFTIFICPKPLTDEKMRYFGNKTNCIWLPPDQMGRYIRKEIGKLVRQHVKAL